MAGSACHQTPSLFTPTREFRNLLLVLSVLSGLCATARAQTPCSSGAYALSVSSQATRANATPLNGAALVTNAYVFTASAGASTNINPPGVSRVCYWLDNTTMSSPARHCESIMPYDFVNTLDSVAGSPAAAWDTTTVANGPHAITQQVTLTSGVKEVDMATFTVSNAGSAPPTPAPTTTTLLFQSDFGGTVQMGTPTQMSNCSTNTGQWPVLGGDDGFSWPISIYGGSSLGLQPTSTGPKISYDAINQTMDSCTDNSLIWKAEIIQGTRHDGTTGPVLHRANYQNMYWQLPYVINSGADVPDQYQKIWTMLPTNLASSLGPNQWYELAAWKTISTLCNGENYDYRVAVFIYTDSKDVPYWYMTGTEHSGGPYYWTQSNKTVPVPLGQWFEFEWAWHRTHDNTSWTWVKINGTKIMEQDGGGTTCSGCDPVSGFYNTNAPINRIFVGPMYGDKGPTEQWIDHLELWNSVPQ